MSETTNPITLTDIAAEQLKEIVHDQETDVPVHFRIYVAGGGCSGLQYGFAVDTDGPDESDKSFVEKGINMIVDPMSLQYMEGSEVDFVQDNLLGGGFKVNNPNAVKSCGCQQSFSTKDSEPGCGGCSGCSS